MRSKRSLRPLLQLCKYSSKVSVQWLCIRLGSWKVSGADTAVGLLRTAFGSLRSILQATQQYCRALSLTRQDSAVVSFMVVSAVTEAGKIRKIHPRLLGLWIR